MNRYALPLVLGFLVALLGSARADFGPAQGAATGGGGSGDIEGVSAGSGLSGGGTTGTVSLALAAEPDVTALTIGGATTNGIRLEVSGGDLYVKEGDDSATEDVICRGVLASDGYYATSADLGNAGELRWYSGAAPFSGSLDTSITRGAAGVVNFGDGSTGGGAAQFKERTAPSGLANAARLYAVDNGAGKTQLYVIFGSGAAQLLATEP